MSWLEASTLGEYFGLYLRVSMRAKYTQINVESGLRAVVVNVCKRMKLVAFVIVSRTSWGV